MKKIFNVTEYGVKADPPDVIQTEAIQKVIDLAAAEGGEICFPEGRYSSGSLFFKENTSLRLEKNALGVMKKFLLALIRFYQRHISPGLPPRCRFRPTCSQYAVEAVEKYGAAKGGFLALKRFLRCHPFHRGGWYDPVP